MSIDEVRDLSALYLDAAGIAFDRHGEEFRFGRTREGFIWVSALTFQEDYAHLFGALPFIVPEDLTTDALSALNALNRSLAEGCFFLIEDKILLRQTVFLPDAFAVKSALTAALSRQALFMLWGRDAFARFHILVP